METDDWTEEVHDYDGEDVRDVGDTLDAAVEHSSRMFKELVQLREDKAALTAENERLSLDIEIYKSIESCLRTIWLSCLCEIGNDVY